MKAKVIYHVFKLCLMKMKYYNSYNKLNCLSAIILIYYTHILSELIFFSLMLDCPMFSSSFSFPSSPRFRPARLQHQLLRPGPTNLPTLTLHYEMNLPPVKSLLDSMEQKFSARRGAAPPAWTVHYEVNLPRLASSPLLLPHSSLSKRTFLSSDCEEKPADFEK